MAHVGIDPEPVAVALVALIVAGLALLGLAVGGAPNLTSIWPGLAIGAAAVSLAALVLFWDRQLLWGVAIDVTLIVVASWRRGVVASWRCGGPAGRTASDGRAPTTGRTRR